MRIPGHKIHRAFHELDPFTDEQCVRFVRTARGSRWRRLRTALLLVLVWLLTLGLLWFIAYRIQESWPPHLAVRLTLGPRGETLRDFLLIAVALGLPTLFATLTRDVRLRRRIRRVINTRGSCASCGYGLTGLSVGDAFEVRCPECNFVLLADPTLGEVVADSAGVTRYLPSPDRIGSSRWLTPRRRKWILRIGIGGPIAAVVLLGTFWLLYERFLQKQAAQALAQRPTPAAVEAHLAPYLVGQPSDPDAWEVFFEVSLQIQKSDAAWQQPTNSKKASKVPDFSSVAEFYPTVRDQNEELDVALAERVLQVYENDGVFKLMDAMSATPRANRSVPWPTGGAPLSAVFRSDLSNVRQLTRINTGRMRLAYKERDLARFKSSVEAGFALDRMLRTSPLLIEWLTADAVLGLHNRTISEVLSQRPDPAYVHAILDARERQASQVPREAQADASRDLDLDALGWFYAEPERVRFGVFSARISPGLVNSTRFVDPWAQRLGSLEESNAYVNDCWQVTRKALQTLPFQRPDLAWPDPPGMVVDQLFGGSPGRSVRISDEAKLREFQITVLCALELYRAAHGEYPERLEQLIPDQLSTVPPDPWTGQPFGYRRLAPGPSGLPRFVLYSAGSDREDNHGTFAGEGDIHSVLFGFMPGFDARLNFDPEAKNGTMLP